MTELMIASIRLDSDAQSRLDVSPDFIAEYAEAMQAGDVFPPVTVFNDGQTNWLADGFHRVKAAQVAEIKSINAKVNKGDKRDAILHSVGCNAIHGMRRSPQDKRAAVRKLLNDADWAQWSDREIARRCKVHHTFVGKIRAVHTGVVASMDRTFTHHKTGKPAKMNTENIGAGPIEPAATPVPEPTSGGPERMRYDQDGNLLYDPWEGEKRERYTRQADFTLDILDGLKKIASLMNEPACELVLPEYRGEVGQLLEQVTTTLTKTHDAWRNQYGAQ